MKKTLICISCPIGCFLDVEYNNESVVKVDGAGCKRGTVYAEKELFNPERVVTSTVKIIGAQIPLIPVKTDTTVSKQKMFDIMDEIFKLSVNAPVKLGDIIEHDICGSGANLVATRSLSKA